VPSAPVVEADVVEVDLAHLVGDDDAFACSTCGRTDLPPAGNWDPPICQECDAAINEDALREIPPSRVASAPLTGHGLLRGRGDPGRAAWP
jgi:hypothetical protein